MEILQKICLVLTIIGAINWGLIGLLDFNLVSFLFGEMTMLSRIVYSLVGIAGLINIGLLFVHLEDH
ncbi:yuzA [Firmicutes bacterium CAG:822]|nr:yuzA [Firmicutes bacterium CAG:822]